MEALLSPRRHMAQHFGVYSAIVVDIQDPENRYRVKVKFPWMMESDTNYINTADEEDMTSQWARVSSFMAGTMRHSATEEDGLRGAFFLPEVDDEVLVAFMHGDFREPIIIGQLYNGQDKPFWKIDKEADNGVQEAGMNQLRGIRSKSGHMISFVDHKEGEIAPPAKIVIQTKVQDANVYDQPAVADSPTVVNMANGRGGNNPVPVYPPDGSKGSHMIVMEETMETDHILISDGQGKNLIKLDAKRDQLVIYAQRDLVIEACHDLHINCKGLKVNSETTEFKSNSTWIQHSGGQMDLKSDADIVQKGSTIKLN